MGSCGAVVEHLFCSYSGPVCSGRGRGFLRNCSILPHSVLSVVRVSASALVTPCIIRTDVLFVKCMSASNGGFQVFAGWC